MWRAVLASLPPPRLRNDNVTLGAGAQGRALELSTSSLRFEPLSRLAANRARIVQADYGPVEATSPGRS